MEVSALKSLLAQMNAESNFNRSKESPASQALQGQFDQLLQTASTPGLGQEEKRLIEMAMRAIMLNSWDNWAAVEAEKILRIVRPERKMISTAEIYEAICHYTG
jgi:hypothetical protein